MQGYMLYSDADHSICYKAGIKKKMEERVQDVFLDFEK